MQMNRKTEIGIRISWFAAMHLNQMGKLNRTKNENRKCGRSINQLAAVHFRFRMHRVWKHIYPNNRCRQTIFTVSKLASVC